MKTKFSKWLGIILTVFMLFNTVVMPITTSAEESGEVYFSLNFETAEERETAGVTTMVENGNYVGYVPALFEKSLNPAMTKDIGTGIFRYSFDIKFNNASDFQVFTASSSRRYCFGACDGYIVGVCTTNYDNPWGPKLVEVDTTKWYNYEFTMDFNTNLGRLIVTDPDGNKYVDEYTSLIRMNRGFDRVTLLDDSGAGFYIDNIIVEAATSQEEEVPPEEEDPEDESPEVLPEGTHMSINFESSAQREQLSNVVYIKEDDNHVAKVSGLYQKSLTTDLTQNVGSGIFRYSFDVKFTNTSDFRVFTSKASERYCYGAYNGNIVGICRTNFDNPWGPQLLSAQANMWYNYALTMDFNTNKAVLIVTDSSGNEYRDINIDISRMNGKFNLICILDNNGGDYYLDNVKVVELSRTPLETQGAYYSLDFETEDQRKADTNVTYVQDNGGYAVKTSGTYQKTINPQMAGNVGTGLFKYSFDVKFTNTSKFSIYTADYKTRYCFGAYNGYATGISNSNFDNPWGPQFAPIQPNVWYNYALLMDLNGNKAELEFTDANGNVYKQEDIDLSRMGGKFNLICFTVDNGAEYYIDNIIVEPLEPNPIVLEENIKLSTPNGVLQNDWEAVGVLTKTIDVKFVSQYSENMSIDEDTLTDSTFYVIKKGDETLTHIPATITYADGVATLTFDDDVVLDEFTTYTLVLEDGIQSTEERPLLEKFTFDFVTGKAVLNAELNGVYVNNNKAKGLIDVKGDTNIKIDWYNPGEEAEDVVLFAAFYDDSGKLLEIDSKPVAIPNTSKKGTINLPYTIPTVDGAITVKFMVFDVLDGVKPISEFMIFGGMIVDFENEISSDATADITVLTHKKYTGDLEIYWDNGTAPLANTKPVAYKTLTGEEEAVNLSLHDKLFVPDGATHISAFVNDEIIYRYEIPENKVFDESIYGEKLYSFGQLSDVHLPAISTAPQKFTNALNYFYSNDCELISICGDLLQDNNLGELQVYKNTVAPFADKFPIYNAAGNHDAITTIGFDTWKNYVDYPDGQNPLYFEVIQDKGTADTSDDDVFLYMGLNEWNISAPFSDEQLDWFIAKLEEHKDKTVFLNEHVFLTDTAGDLTTPSGTGLYATTGGGVLTGNINYRGNTFNFRELLYSYDNIIHFSGHSHFMFDLQSLDPNLNIFEDEGGYTAVHVSSCGFPNRPDDTLTSRYGVPDASEGYIVDVYENHVVLKAVDFTTNKIITEATYVINK